MSLASDLLANLLAQAEFYAGLPQQRRLYEAAKTAIHLHHLGAGTKLPSSRDLARDLCLARNTVVAAFEQLSNEGYVTSSLGSGTYVADLAQLKSLDDPRAQTDSAEVGASSVTAQAAPLSRRGAHITAFAAGPRFEIEPFVPGDADFTHFPFKLWQRLQNRVWREARSELLDYADAGGFLPLRLAIAEYLRASRSVKVAVENIVITSGTHQSLDLCAQLLADVGDIAWVEDPCYWAARRVFEACDLALRPIAVDAEGMALSPHDLGTDPRLIYVTPSHQYPTGAVMSLARRRELLDVAVRKNAWILEDDYDSEFRYTGRPLASLQGLDTDERVVYMGTFSKILYPGIKIGYMVVPSTLAEPFKIALYDLQRPGQLMVQAALADFISEGHFTTHIRKIRQIYGARRELLRKTLVAQFGMQLSQRVTISSEESGLHLVVELPDQVDDVALEKLAAESGMSVKALSTYYLAQPVRRGLLVGYAYVTPDKIVYYGKLLAAVIQSGVR